jgi:hypothetical protein
MKIASIALGFAGEAVVGRLELALDGSEEC